MPRDGKYRVDVWVYDDVANSTFRWQAMQARFATFCDAYDAADNRTDAWRIVRQGVKFEDDRVKAYGPAMTPRGGAA